MDDANMRNLERMSSPDLWEKFSKLLSYAGIADDIADPWYTGNFDETYEDVSAGCKGLLQQLKYRKEV
jgi:protein-tyrosine phosphatase